MRSLPLALALSIVLWALIVGFVVGLPAMVSGPSAIALLTEVAAAARTLMAGAML